MNNKHGGFQGPVIAAVMVMTMTMLAAEIAVGQQTAKRDFGQVAGYRRDGSGIYPDCKPPVQFDFAKDLRWEAQTPGWSLSSPIVVKDRVYVVSEPSPTNYWPELLCYSLADGKMLWRKELDSAEALFPDDAAKRADATAKWKDYVDGTRKGIALRWRYLDAIDAAEKERIVAEAAAMGIPFDRRAGGLDIGKRPNQAEQFGFDFGGWYPKYPSVIGIAYSTPVSDGKHLYVTTWHGLVACFDLDGNRQWLSYRRVDDRKIHNCGCSGARSPIIYNDPAQGGAGLLISDLGDVVCAFDRHTGKLLWQDTTDCDTIVSPGILTVPTQDGKTADVLWAAGAQPYLLPEGKRLKMDGWDGVTNHGVMTLVKYDEPDVVFINGQGEHSGWDDKGNCETPPPAALRCKLEGDPAGAGQATLKVTVLWTGVKGKAYKGSSHCPNMCYYNGKLYFPGSWGVVFDALTGEVVQGNPATKSNKIVAETHHMLKVAGGNLYGLNGLEAVKATEKTPGAVLQVSSPEGTIIATSKIPELPLSEADREIIKYTSSQWKSGSKGWGSFAYTGSDTFAFGPDCIIIRGNSRLYCIGKKDTGETK